MVGAEHRFAVGKGPLVERDRLLQTPRKPVGGGEVVARGQVGVCQAT